MTHILTEAQNWWVQSVTAAQKERYRNKLGVVNVSTSDVLNLYLKKNEKLYEARNLSDLEVKKMKEHLEKDSRNVKRFALHTKNKKVIELANKLNLI